MGALHVQIEKCKEIDDFLDPLGCVVERVVLKHGGGVAVGSWILYTYIYIIR